MTHPKYASAFIVALVTQTEGVSVYLGRYAQPRSPVSQKTMEGCLRLRPMATLRNVRLSSSLLSAPPTNRAHCTFTYSGLMFGIPVTPPSSYLTISLRNLGFSTINTNLLTIPSQFGNILAMLAITMVSEVVNDRALVSMAEAVWAFPFLVALRLLPTNSSPWKFYVRRLGLMFMRIYRMFIDGFLC